MNLETGEDIVGSPSEASVAGRAEEGDHRTWRSISYRRFMFYNLLLVRAFMIGRRLRKAL